MQETTVYIKQSLLLRIGATLLFVVFSALCFLMGYAGLQEPVADYLTVGIMFGTSFLLLALVIFGVRRPLTTMILQQDGIKMVWIKGEPLIAWTNIKEFEKVVLPGRSKQTMLGIYLHQPISPETKMTQVMQQFNGVILRDDTPPDLYIQRVLLAKNVDKTIEDIKTYRANHGV